MEAFYTLAPKISVNKELGASMLATTNDYGGSVDLATAKLISEIGSKSEARHGSHEDMLAFISGGKNLSSVSTSKKQ